MGNALQKRNDILGIANSTRFYLRHFARGFYPVHSSGILHMPLNRMFIPLDNPDGDDNFIEDATGRYVLKAGTLYFIPAYYDAIFHLTPHLYFLSIQANLEVFPRTDFFSGCRSMRVVSDFPELPDFLDLFEGAKEHLPFTALHTRCKVFALLLKLATSYPDEDFHQILVLKKYTILISYLEKHGSATTRVKNLAELLHESRECFTRHFSAMTGITPKQLIDRFLIGKSIDLLATPMICKEIANQLGFSNEFVFSRFFKNHTGESPTSWRLRLGQNR